MQQRAVLTRGRVLSAAAEVFAKTGFLAASMNDIVEAAGVTKGAVYFHFASKEALAVAIVEEQFAQWPPIVGRIIELSPDALTTVVALTYEVGARFRDDVLVTAGIRLSFERELVNADMPTPFVGWMAILRDLFSRARREGQLRPGVLPAATARALVGGFFGIQHVSDVLTNRTDLEGSPPSRIGRPPSGRFAGFAPACAGRGSTRHQSARSSPAEPAEVEQAVARRQLERCRRPSHGPAVRVRIWLCRQRSLSARCRFRCRVR